MTMGSVGGAAAWRAATKCGQFRCKRGGDCDSRCLDKVPESHALVVRQLREFAPQRMHTWTSPVLRHQLHGHARPAHTLNLMRSVVNGMVRWW